MSECNFKVGDKVIILPFEEHEKHLLAAGYLKCSDAPIHDNIKYVGKDCILYLSPSRISKLNSMVGSIIEIDSKSKEFCVTVKFSDSVEGDIMGEVAPWQIKKAYHHVNVME